MDMSDLHALVKILDSQIVAADSSDEYMLNSRTPRGPRPKIVLVGFSLGAGSLLRYAHRMRQVLPSTVVAGIAVGGACSSEVAEWPRCVHALRMDDDYNIWIVLFPILSLLNVHFFLHKIPGTLPTSYCLEDPGRYRQAVRK